MRGVIAQGLDVRALVILVVSLLATVVAWWGVASQADALRDARFKAIADETVSEIVNRMAGYEQILRGGAAMMEASEEVGRDEWKHYVARLEISVRYPGIQGVGYAVRVDGESLDRHEKGVRLSGYPDYSIRPSGEREAYYPIIFLEPMDWRNLRAFGYDMFSEPIRREAMARARDLGAPALTGKVTLVQEADEDVQAGTLLYMPVYMTRTDISTEAGRRASILGFVYSPFRMGDLMTAILGERIDTLCVSLFDQDERNEALLFSNPCRAGGLVLTSRIDMYGRQWVINVRSTPAMEAALSDGVFSKVVLASGIIISLLLVLSTQLMALERRRRVTLAQANADIDAARREAEAANAAKTRFLAAASHDLRQPLQTLGIYLHLISEQSGERMRPLVGAAMQGFETTQRLLNSLLDIAALESGKLRPQVVPVDIAALLSRITDEVRPRAIQKGLKLRLRTCPDMVAETDVVMLERVVRNLVDNALKYTERGGVLVACRAMPDEVRISVADSGPGIAPEQRDLIFEDFYQLANPERDRHKGLGLGLATVARLSRLLGYRLELYSRVGRGSAFVVVVSRRSAVPRIDE